MLFTPSIFKMYDIKLRTFYLKLNLFNILVNIS